MLKRFFIQRSYSDTKFVGLSLEENDLKEMLIKIAKMTPSAWDIVKLTKENDSCMTSEHIPSEWCVCGKCIIMPRETENLCCRNHTKNYENPEFRCLVLNDKMLELSMKTDSDWLSYRFNPQKNASWRYRA